MGLLSLARCRRDCCDHRDASSAAGHAALQEPGQLGVPEGDVHCIAVRQLPNHRAQRQQALVDEAALSCLALAIADISLKNR